MIADDTAAIRDGMRKLAQAKVTADAEAAKRAEADSKPTELRKPCELFPETGTPFRGFFLSEDGDVVPFDLTDERAALLGTPPGGMTTVLAYRGGHTITHEWYSDGKLVNYTEAQQEAVQAKLSALNAEILKTKSLSSSAEIFDADINAAYIAPGSIVADRDDPRDDVTIDGGSFMWGQL